MHNEGMIPANAQRADKYDTAEHIRKQAQSTQNLFTLLCLWLQLNYSNEHLHVVWIITAFH